MRHAHPRSDISPTVLKFQRYIETRPQAAHSYAILLGLPNLDWPQLLRAVEHGLGYEAFERLRESAGLPADDVSRWLQLASRTLARRKQQGRFGPEESDRLLRAARLLGRAIELFEGDVEAAREWLVTTQPALGNETPLEIARTDVGSREVENLIGRIEHGVFS